ncbi:MAG: hypothetical protein ACI9FD_000898 [Gammaproteobacteria bacterium]|jgi:hypothetical protein
MDAAWFFIDKSNPHTHFGPLLILSPPKNAPASYVQDFVNDWRNSTTFSPPFNYRLSKGIIPLWDVLEDNQVDLALAGVAGTRTRVWQP